MFGGTTISQVKVWHHPLETTIYKWMFQVPGSNHQNKWLVLKVVMESGKLPETNGDHKYIATAILSGNTTLETKQINTWLIIPKAQNKDLDLSWFFPVNHEVFPPRELPRLN